ncbi:MAG: hypothetical protein AAFV19_09910 [Pseudomonadota bacterium]
MSRLWILVAALGWAPTVSPQDLAPGRYLVEVAIVLPNIQTRDYNFETEICWRGIEDRDPPLGPLGPGPLKRCPSKVAAIKDGIAVETTCLGPNAGWGSGTYKITPTGFKATVEMNMGGKNMTLKEIQRGTRLGSCE